ncbi:MAG: ABC transporter permease [Thermodesulfobacteriota bacterium]
MSFRRLMAVTRKEWIHIVRDWRSLTLAIAIPILLILLYGYALTLDVKNVPVQVWDRSKTPASRMFLSQLEGSPYFVLVGYCETYVDIRHSLETGNAMVGLVIPADFADRLPTAFPRPIQVLIDGSDANTARLVLNYLELMALEFGRTVVSENTRMDRSRLLSPVELKPRVWYNEEMKSQNAILPGIIAIVLMVIAAMLTSVTIAREWETGTMEQLISTPIRVPELIFGKTVPYMAIGMLDVAIALGMSIWVFGVPFRGNPALLFLMAAVFLTGALFLGMTLSIVLKSQVLANQLAIAIGFLPTLMLSGFVFAIWNMPRPLQWLTMFLPGRYFITILRGIVLKGVGWEVLGIEAVFLLVYATCFIAVAHRKLKLELE